MKLIEQLLELLLPLLWHALDGKEAVLVLPRVQSVQEEELCHLEVAPPASQVQVRVPLLAHGEPQVGAPVDEVLGDGEVVLHVVHGREPDEDPAEKSLLTVVTGYCSFLLYFSVTQCHWVFNKS